MKLGKLGGRVLGARWHRAPGGTMRGRGSGVRVCWAHPASDAQGQPLCHLGLGDSHPFRMTFTTCKMG